MIPPADASQRIQDACRRRPDLKFKTWPRKVPKPAPEHPTLLGYCYVATQAFCAVVPEAVPYCDDYRSHFWAVLDGKVWDLTDDQFTYRFPYEKGRPTKFPTLTARTKALLVEAKLA